MEWRTDVENMPRDEGFEFLVCRRTSNTIHHVSWVEGPSGGEEKILEVYSSVSSYGGLQFWPYEISHWFQLTRPEEL